MAKHLAVTTTGAIAQSLLHQRPHHAVAAESWQNRRPLHLGEIGKPAQSQHTNRFAAAPGDQVRCRNKIISVVFFVIRRALLTQIGHTPQGHRHDNMVETARHCDTQPVSALRIHA